MVNYLIVGKLKYCIFFLSSVFEVFVIGSIDIFGSNVYLFLVFVVVNLGILFVFYFQFVQKGFDNYKMNFIVIKNYIIFSFIYDLQSYDKIKKNVIIFLGVKCVLVIV